MQITDRLILTITLTGLAMVVTFTPDCVNELDQITEDEVGDRFCGDIRPSAIEGRGNVTFIRVRENGVPDILTFTDHGMMVNHTYTVTGEITMYHGRLEIVVNTAEPVRAGR